MAGINREGVDVEEVSGSTFTLHNGGIINEYVNTDACEFFYHFKWFANFLY